MMTTSGTYTKVNLTQQDIDAFLNWLYAMNIVRVA